MKDFLIRAVNVPLRSLGLSLVSRQSLLLTYQHDYGADGYEKYRKTQVFHNRRKIDQVWADEETLSVIASYIKTHVPVVRAGICHGTRRGYEQAEFSRQLGCPVIGTEISDSAGKFANTVQWDFHEQKVEWRNRFSFRVQQLHRPGVRSRGRHFQPGRRNSGVGPAVPGPYDAALGGGGLGDGPIRRSSDGDAVPLFKWGRASIGYRHHRDRSQEEASRMDLCDPPRDNSVILDSDKR